MIRGRFFFVTIALALVATGGRAHAQAELQPDREPQTHNPNRVVPRRLLDRPRQPITLPRRRTHVTVPSPEQLDRVDVSAGLEATVERLNHIDYVQRERASVALLAPSFRQIEIYAVLNRNTLTAEQRHRLLAAAQERLLTKPRGAVGISMLFDQPDPGRPGAVVVRELLPGLPAERVLLRGDRITLIDGEPLSNSNDLVLRVQSKRPGDLVDLVVEREIRGAEPGDAPTRTDVLEITLVLGSVKQIDEIQGQRSASVVQRMREDEAAAAANAFGPQARLIRIVTPPVEPLTGEKPPRPARTG